MFSPNLILIKETKESYFLKAKTGPAKITKIPKKLSGVICILTGINNW